MKIINVNVSNLDQFIEFPNLLYKDDDKYVPYIKNDQRKTLKELIVNKMTYTGLLAFDDNDHVLARVLFTIDKSKQLKSDRCGFFSMYECVNDLNVSKAILSEMKKQLIEKGAEYIVGTFFPFDQDNRRGIMVKGFEKRPLIFTSYNFAYYNEQLTAFGFLKQADTYEYTVDFNDDIVDKIEKLDSFCKRHFNIRVDKVDLKHPEIDIKDIANIMEIATNEIIYQEAPSYDTLAETVNGLKAFLDSDYLLIARNNEDNKPIGFVAAIPDYFEIIQKIKGELNLMGMITFLLNRKKIRSLRCILQYVIPEYQKKGVLAVLACELYRSIKKNHIEYIEAGTIMENNKASNETIKAFGGELTRIYRLYYLELK